MQNTRYKMMRDVGCEMKEGLRPYPLFYNAAQPPPTSNIPHPTSNIKRITAPVSGGADKG
jgi:hypothetical protein